ncbi:MAG TPA: hypothetical protein DCW71_01855 [Alistipes sp.]|nr:hypothetical protein [Alistipes sp.]
MQATAKVAAYSGPRRSGALYESDPDGKPAGSEERLAEKRCGAGSREGAMRSGTTQRNATDHETAVSGVQKSVIRTECEWDEGLSEGKIAIEFHDGAGLPGSREEEGAVRRVLPTL